jgi:hypothetical protein
MRRWPRRRYYLGRQSRCATSVWKNWRVKVRTSWKMRLKGCRS